MTKLMDPKVKVISQRPKKFRSMESLWFEEERLATFINWPLKHISYTALAAEGFYYLRMKDHCACAFCRGIIGAWELGDTPSGEHKRHFPHCPIVSGNVTGNVPLALGKILNKLPKELQQDLELDTVGTDVCGTGIISNGLPLIHTINEDLSMKSLGFKEYSGPKRNDYLTVGAREKSFMAWPEEVEQTPRALAEAGFYYCGLSDHVRCFHCGNGLRNWENNDSPWGEHARWYADCNYVLLTKGKVFIDQVQRENPPFIPSFASESIPREEGSAVSSSPCSSCSLSEEEIDQLMNLDTINAVVKMGFTARIARIALKRKLIQTGLPFFTIDTAMRSVLEIMDEETKTTINGCEYITSQADKMSSHATDYEDIPPMRRNVDMAQDISASTLVEENNFRSSVLSHTGISALLENSSPPLRASTPASDLDSNNDSGRSSESEQEEIISQATSEPEENSIQLSTNITEESTSAPSSVVMENVETSSINVIEVTTSPSSVVMDNVETLINVPETEQRATPILSTHINQTVSMGEPLESSGDEYLMESDEVTDDETKLSVPSKSSSSSSSASQSSEGSHDSGFDKDMELDEVSSQTKQLVDVNKLSTTEEASSLAQELETLKENRQCRVCMDKEMDIVFLPCTHMVTCSSCALALSACPVCRSNIQYAFKPIIS